MGQYIEIVSMPIITTIVYWIMNLIKYSTNYNEKVLRLIPLFSAICGCICGLAIYYLEPNLLTVNSVFVAIVIGGASGMSATGFNQVLKQMNKKDIQ